MKTGLKMLFCFVLLSGFSTLQAQQETVFSLFKTNERLADEYYHNKNYSKALTLYSSIYKKHSAPGDTRLKIGRCLYFLKQYKKASAIFDSYFHANPGLSREDLGLYAESMASSGNYRKAVEAFRELTKRFPDDTLAAQKLWRLNNIQYVYEDSLHYVVRPVPVNSTASEIFLASSPNSILFLSNREQVQIIQKHDYSEMPFYQLYTARTFPDTLIEGVLRYGRAALMPKQFDARLHAGPLALYDHSSKMVLVRSGEETSVKGERTLRLFFAELKKGTWQITGEFPFNNKDYSITDPAISPDGMLLYFASDMPGGKGGKDIYRSEKKNGEWSRPENVSSVNTPFDEVSPHLHRDQAFYFSSNGHAGMGGLDIFKIEKKGLQWEEVTNVGYPINSSSDDFGMVVDSLGTHGYFSSNRKNGGFDDDIYEVEMDLQTYPLIIDCIVRIKEHNWSDSSEMKPFASARFSIIDNIRNVTVFETKSDNEGHFSITLPYFSKYRIRVVGPERDEHVVSLEIPKHRKVYEKHEIVLVKDIYQKNENELRTELNKEP